MCRIAGIVGFSKTSASDVRTMCNSMHRGGPDDEGFYQDTNLGIVLGHRRLSIIDLSSAGHQPMISSDGQIIISYNGELFNYLELKEVLVQNGLEFKTHSDTEVIIQAYRFWGEDCFQKFNGMYALAILDKDRNQLLLARDHAGIKPLYYSFHEGALYFASELRAFRELGFWETNEDWKIYFLAFGHIPEPVTTLNNVYPLSKGHYLIYDLTARSQKQEQFYYPSFKSKIYVENKAIAAINETLSASVKRHLISDAPIGLFLSGGIDSSILTIVAKPFIPESLRTLSINFDSVEFSEKYYQDLVIDKTGAKHESFQVVAQDLKDSLTDILEAMDSPSIDGINSYFISKYARQIGLKAVLSGLGADELLGGYKSFQRASIVGKLKKLPGFLLRVMNWLPGDKYQRISYLALNHPIGEYLFYRGLFSIKDISQILGLSSKEVNQVLKALPVPEELKSLKGAERAGFFEFNYYMQNQLLKDTDYMSMWHGLEVRVPFLDKEFIELCNSINSDMKFNHTIGKFLLIEAFKGILPQEVWNREKSGFTFPFNDWFKKDNNLLGNYKIPESYLKKFKDSKMHWSKVWCLAILNES